jgi:hypothetical protein
MSIYYCAYILIRIHNDAFTFRHSNSHSHAQKCMVAHLPRPPPAQTRTSDFSLRCPVALPLSYWDIHAETRLLALMSCSIPTSAEKISGASREKIQLGIEPLHFHFVASNATDCAIGASVMTIRGMSATCYWSSSTPMPSNSRKEIQRESNPSVPLFSLGR